ncbi:glycoside hydrolase family 3 N-terminal domain-containing protein [Caldicoprobacter faecalis]|uniref:glycoside hydrolase family 3 N-terminal domain-containing protein n=1 Tax=Caldicoprobacter faecalis TaxID=937334 RepID=UPI000B85F056|nr:glycoside hydrolase family 3 N-terminal domain-containing protein [Caldicoprobacter faecalis]
MDSCVDLPRLEHHMQCLKSFELIPFKRAIEEGADMVVEAHIVFPDITEEKVPVIALKLKYGLNDQLVDASRISQTVGIKERRAVADRA